MKDDELDQWRRYKNGDADAHEELILHYLYLVKIQVGVTCRKASWASREDLMQEGIKGLMTALALYKPDSGKEFEAYAQKFIRGAVVRNPEVSRMGRYQYEIYRDVGKAHDELMRELGRMPNIEEIVERSGLTEDQVNNALNATSICFARQFSDYDAESITGRATVAHEDERILIQELLCRLGKKTRRIVIEYYWNGRTDEEIAGRFGMKKDTIKKNRQRAITKLGTLIEAEKGTERYEV